MSKATLAYSDLIATLKDIPWLNVYEEVGKSGARGYSLEVYRGTTTFAQKIGCQTNLYGYGLTLKTSGTTDPADLAEKVGIINNRIIHDRRRGGNAQSTVMAEEGWTPDEEEGREAFSISTTLEIYIKEVN